MFANLNLMFTNNVTIEKTSFSMLFEEIIVKIIKIDNNPLLLYKTMFSISKEYYNLFSNINIIFSERCNVSTIPKFSNKIGFIELDYSCQNDIPENISYKCLQILNINCKCSDKIYFHHKFNNLLEKCINLKEFFYFMQEDASNNFKDNNIFVFPDSIERITIGCIWNVAKISIKYFPKNLNFMEFSSIYVESLRCKTGYNYNHLYSFPKSITHLILYKFSPNYTDISHLENLKILEIYSCKEIDCTKLLPESLKKLFITFLRKIITLPPKLEKLDIWSTDVSIDKLLFPDSLKKLVIGDDIIFNKKLI